MTKMVLCAFNTTESVTLRSDFLACWDQSFTGMSPVTSILASGEKCAFELGLPVSQISTCTSSSEGDALEALAARQFEAQFPDSTFVPNVIINGISQTDISFDALLATLCATGINAAGCPVTSLPASRQVA